MDFLIPARPDTQNASIGRRGFLFFGSLIFIVCFFFSILSQANAQSTDDTILTNISQIWTVPHADQEYRIKTEFLIYFDDPEWGNALGECEGNPGWLPIFDSPYPLKAGERVAIDGVIVPARERFVWSKTKIQVLQEHVPLVGETITNLDENARQLAAHLITVEGLVDSVWDKQTHCTMGLLFGDMTAHAYILKGRTNDPIPFKEGDIVRVTCVDSPEFDRDGKVSSLSLWVDGPGNVQVIGSLANDGRFNLPLTTCKDIASGLPQGGLVHVQGIVHKYDAGQWVTIWDGTGQIMIQSRQSQMLRFGDPVEAVGYPEVIGVQEYLNNGLYRVSTNADEISQAVSTNALPLRLAEQIRDMSPEDAAKHLPVKLRGIVVWARHTGFAYVLDGSGGIKIMNPKWDDPGTRMPGTIVTVDGVTDEGSFVPVVTNAMLHRSGWFNIEGPKSISLEQALTGVEEGNWVEMQGFVRNVSVTKGLARFDLSTSSGNFQAYAPAPQPSGWYKGSIIQIDGVCTATANYRHQLTGIQLWCPDVNFIQVEEPAPDDLFSAPVRPLGNLRRFNVESTLNQRVHTTGTVVLYAPRRYLCVQDGADSVLALSMQTNSVQPGDKVEVVGFPGQQGQKFILREAAYRLISHGTEPSPARLSAVNASDSNLEGLLVTANGTLLNTLEKNGETRLLVQGKDFIFEASLDPTAGNENLQHLQLNSRIALTGVYAVQNDEYGRPHSFLIRLRSWNDIKLVQQPPWWTPARLCLVLAGTVLVFIVALVWGFLIARKNHLLYQAQTELQVVNDKLEIRVEERTRELQSQVKAKELAHTELANTQRDLMLASRQAGMAEVATGVLHNVGNVLNSVNVSATLLRDQTRRSKTRSLIKVSHLLQEKNGELGNYLTSDPKGKLIPQFFIEVAGELEAEQKKALTELEQLTKNIDHIKDIVAMQQSYARKSGVMEKVTLQSLVEDALQMSSGALTRHEIKIIRQFADVPAFMMDKHKVLQILINLIRNGRHALEASGQVEKRITITVAKDGDNAVMVRVEDNGVGIPEENLIRIFSHGFTTKPDGHGFGLHIGALNAKEMGGSLNAASEGVGRGAAFTLVLPFSAAS